MKKCPICHRSFSDPTLNFCLDDGATLINQTGNFGQASQPPAFYPQTGQPRKSKSWLWILGILVMVVVVGAGGIIGLIALIANSSGNSNDGKRPVNRSNNVNRGSSPANSKSPSSSSTAKNNEPIDLARWGEFKSAAGEAKLVGDEYQLSAAKNGYYVVISSTKFDDKYLTNNSIVKVTAHSVSGSSPTLGYGLVVNSDIDPLKSDYAFLINSDNQTYRVVSHEDEQEGSVVNWTYAPQIRTGTQTNQLEVRSSSTKLSFYINGQFATSITDESGSDQGVVGLYTSGNYPIGFSDLQIVKN